MIKPLGTTLFGKILQNVKDEGWVGLGARLSPGPSHKGGLRY